MRNKEIIFLPGRKTCHACEMHVEMITNSESKRHNETGCNSLVNEPSKLAIESGWYEHDTKTVGEIARRLEVETRLCEDELSKVCVKGHRG